MKTRSWKPATATLSILLGLALLLPISARAHCDTLDGPVVQDARTALAKGEVTPVLRWVRPEDEQAIGEAFAEAVAVRRLGPAAKAMADRYFFETLVRIHRAGEGAPYTGLKPAGRVEPAIARADQALATGTVDELAKDIARHTEEGIRERFARAAAARKQADKSVAAGREYVEAYVAYIHYVEGLADAVHHGPAHGGAEGH